MSTFSGWNGPGEQLGGAAYQEILGQIRGLSDAIGQLQRIVWSTDSGTSYATIDDRIKAAINNPANGYVTRQDVTDDINTHNTGAKSSTHTDIVALSTEITAAIGSDTTADTIKYRITQLEKATTGLDTSAITDKLKELRTDVDTLKDKVAAFDLSSDFTFAADHIDVLKKLVIKAGLDFDQIFSARGIEIKPTSGDASEAGEGAINFLTLRTLSKDHYVSSKKVFLIARMRRDTDEDGVEGGTNSVLLPGNLYVYFKDTDQFRLNINFAGGGISVTYEHTVSNAATPQNINISVWQGTRAGLTDTNKYYWIGIDPADGGDNMKVQAAGFNVDFNSVPNMSSIDSLTKVGESAICVGEYGWCTNGQMAVKEITADKITGLDGSTILDGSDPNKVVIGDQSKTVIINSKDRIVVKDGNATHGIAYLNDLNDGVSFQRSVTAYAPTLAILNSYNVDVDVNGVIVTRGTGLGTKPGMYWSNPLATDVSGTLFAAGDWGLVRNGGTEAPVADGDAHINLATERNITAAQITGIDSELIQVGTTLFDGTTYAQVDTWSGNAGTTLVIASSHPDLSFTIPTYAMFNGSVWSATTTIPLPKTSDGTVLDKALQWYGNVLDTNQGAFHSNSILWAPDHQRPIYGGEDWNFISLIPPNIRTKEEQAVIDNQLLAFAMAPPDWNAVDVPLIPDPFDETGTKKVANPSYILNKPWEGTAILDAGGFTPPYQAWHFIVDAGNVDEQSAPIDIQGPTYRNVMMKIMRGTEATLPPATIDTAGVLKFTTDTHKLFFDNGNVNYPVIGVPPDPGPIPLHVWKRTELPNAYKVDVYFRGDTTDTMAIGGAIYVYVNTKQSNGTYNFEKVQGTYDALGTHLTDYAIDDTITNPTRFLPEMQGLYAIYVKGESFGPSIAAEDLDWLDTAILGVVPIEVPTTIEARIQYSTVY